MDDTFVEPLIAAVIDPVVAASRLLAENDQLRAELDALRRLKLELQRQAGSWQSMHVRAAQRLGEAQQEVELLRAERARLRALRAGRHSDLPLP